MVLSPPLCLLAFQTLFLTSFIAADSSSETAYQRYHDVSAPIEKIRGGHASDSELQWQPVLDFDKDSCYNAPAIDANGNVSLGLDPRYSGAAEDCREDSDLNNNQVYSRARCNHGYCAFVYDYYFKKDVAFEHVPALCGHRHEWEHVVVFTRHDEPILVAASRHGRYVTKFADEIRWLGTHPKIVYHKEGLLTHAFRFAREKDDHPIENHRGEWVMGDLISYWGFPDESVRNKLMDYDFGKATMAISECHFGENIRLAMGDTPRIKGSQFRNEVQEDDCWGPDVADTCAHMQGLDM